jgi:hypothetical protein
MLQQSNNTVEIDKTGYTLASAVKALNSIEDLPRSKKNQLIIKIVCMN